MTKTHSKPSQILEDTTDYTYNDLYRDWTAGTRRSAAKIVPFLSELHQPRSVIDVGCGTGIWLAAWEAVGVTDVLGLDGEWVDRSQLEIPNEKFLVVDLKQPLIVDRIFDLAVSLEVAEHLPPESAEAFVSSLTRLSSVVLFSAAVPGQAGVDHVNEQWPQYWQALFAERGYVLVDFRAHFWEEASILPWYRQNVVLFVEKSVLSASPGLRTLHAHTTKLPLAVVHPDMFALRIEQLSAKIHQLSDIRNTPARQAILALPAIVASAITRKLRMSTSK